MSASLGANALAMLLAKGLPAVFGFTLHVAVARLAGAETLGAYVTLLAVLTIFQSLGGAGVQFYVSREVVAGPDRLANVARQARACGLVSGLVASLLYGLTVWGVLPRAHLLPGLLLGAAVLPSAWTAVQDALFIGTRAHHWIAAVSLVESLLKVGAALAALLAGAGLLGVCLAIVGGRLVALAAGSWFLDRLGHGDTRRMDLAAVGPFARALAPFSLLYLASMLYFRVDVPIVHALAGGVQTGFYGAAVTMYGAALLLLESALSAAYPRLASSFRISHEEYVQATWLVTKVATVTLVPVALAMVAFSDVIVEQVYGNAFRDVAAVLRLLALTLPIHGLNGAMGQALQSGGEQRTMARVLGGGLTVHVASLAVLVSVFGIAGAAVAMIVSSACIAAGALHAWHTRVEPIRLGARALPAVAAVVGPIIIVAVAPPAVRALAAMVGLVWLVAGMCWHGVLAPADLASVRAALGMRRSGVVG